MKRHIRLRGINGAVKGQAWDSPSLLRVGRVDTLEIVLDDSSVSRHHAEVRATDRGWRVRDLGSTNGTRLNGIRLGTGQWPLRPRDLLQFGEVAVVVESLEEAAEADIASPDQMTVEGATRKTWDEAIAGVALETPGGPRRGEELLALLRASHHLGHIENEEQLLNSVLEDAVTVLKAQRGAIVLPDENGVLKIRVVRDGRAEPRAVMAGRQSASRVYFSQSLALRSFTKGESILCHRAEEDPELAMARSIAEGTMSSVLCILLRTPRKRLGVLHLDRGPWDKPFTMDDLELGDALAANVSAGIESAQLLRKQRDLFSKTILMLAQAVELRDKYTCDHTHRVTRYSELLAEQLELSSAEMELIRTGTPLHDIGKIGIRDNILLAERRLTAEEFEEMKLHTVKGAEIISTLPDLHPIIPIVRSHHERWDGKGYPDGLAGEDIPLVARIVAVADAYDAMTTDRPYRKGLPAHVAFAEVDKQKGQQFDPQCAEAFLAIREKVVQETRSHNTTQILRGARALQETA